MKQTEFEPEVIRCTCPPGDNMHTEGCPMVSKVEAWPETRPEFDNKSTRRSEGSRRAWATRRAKAESKPELSGEAAHLKTVIQRVFEKREEVASMQDELECMEAELEALIDMIAKGK